MSEIGLVDVSASSYYCWVAEDVGYLCYLLYCSLQWERVDFALSFYAAVKRRVGLFAMVEQLQCVCC